VQGTIAVPNSETKTRVFISYSRKDMAFADRLEAALKARGYEPLIDRNEVYAFEDWWQRIQALITQADTIIFVLSPESVASGVCRKEVEFAASLNKRFAPVVYQRVDDTAVPGALRRYNYVFCDDAAQFEARMGLLGEALETDIEWVRKHTEFGASARKWEIAGKPDARGLLLRSPLLEEAERWLVRRPSHAPEPTATTRAFVAESRRAAKQRRVRAAAGVLGVSAVVGLGVLGWAKSEALMLRWDVWRNVLPASAEQSLRAKQEFRECSRCPVMVVVSAGEFAMGSPVSREGREGPQHRVTIAERFAVSKFELTFDDWAACVTSGGCGQVDDSRFGRGNQPVINVDWNDAEQYVAWLSQMTGKTYRLLSEAEYEYAARAGTTTLYPWGDDIGKNNANCNGCGSRWDGKQPAPVGSFAPNAFGLYDMVGNVAEWVEDCWHDSYNGAPKDGSAWITGGNCRERVVRTGCWFHYPELIRSANRSGDFADTRFDAIGFRVARTLN
jgi:formylglycine-generating enzyme required for sulfatase activity